LIENSFPDGDEEEVVGEEGYEGIMSPFLDDDEGVLKLTDVLDGIEEEYVE
jgi:hypothetical protein